MQKVFIDDGGGGMGIKEHLARSYINVEASWITKFG